MRTVILALAGIFSVAACSSEGRVTSTVPNDTSNPAVPPGVASIDILPSPINVNKGRSIQLSAIVRDGSGAVLTDRVVTWTTLDTSVATVTTSGKLTGKKTGHTHVRAQSGGATSDSSANVAPPVVSSVTISPILSSLAIGLTSQLTATTRDTDGVVLTDRVVTWASTNPSVASVSTTGLVTALAAGSTSIRATSEAITASMPLTVPTPPPPPPVPVASVSVALNASTLMPGQTTQATATLRDASNNVLTGRTITWASSNTAVATVASNGVVTAVAAGTANVTATSEGISGSASLTVSAPAPAPVASVNVSLAASTVAPGQTTQATATLRDAANNVLTGRTVAWASSNTAVATVASNGVVTAVAAGTATITATSEGISGNASLTVSAPAPAPVASVSVALTSSSLTTGQTTQATATLRDAANNVLTGRVIGWSSSNTSVATVSSTGLVTAVAAGTASIRATSEGVTGSASLTVSAPAPAPVASVSVALLSSSLTTGQTTQATATLRDAANNVLTGRVIAWASSNTGVATVSTAGLVTATGAGTANITATSEGVTGGASLTVSTPSTTRVDTIFYDSFESGTFAKWQDGYNATRHRIATDPTFARVGNNYLDVTYLQGQDGGYLNAWFMPGYDSAYFRYYIRFEPTWQGLTKMFGLYGSRTDNQWSSLGQAGKCPTGTDFFSAMITTETVPGDPPPLMFYTYFPGMAKQSDGVTCYGNNGNGMEHYYPPLTLTRGEWHKVEFWLKLNTPGQSNTVQRFWVDGVLRGEWAGIPLRTSDILRVNIVQLSFNVCCGGAPKTQHAYVDDVLVTTVRPPNP